MLLHDPTKAYAALTYAELLATVGEWEMSRKYYCFVISLDARCARALWGLLMVCDASQQQTGKPSRRPADCSSSLDASFVVSAQTTGTTTPNVNVNSSLMEVAVASLSAIYSETASQRSISAALELLKKFQV